MKPFSLALTQELRKPRWQAATRFVVLTVTTGRQHSGLTSVSAESAEEVCCMHINIGRRGGHGSSFSGVHQGNSYATARGGAGASVLPVGRALLYRPQRFACTQATSVIGGS